MSRKIFSLFLALLTLLGAAAAEGVTVTDMYGREVSLEEPAARIVALTAGECEILCALGGEALLVGRGAWCYYPESILDVPEVQSGAETNIEEILALEPQVVIMSDMNQAKELVDTLERSGVKVVVMKNTDIEGVYASIRTIGALAGKNAEAEALVSGMEAAFADIAAASVGDGKTVYFEISALEWGGLYTAGKGTFMDEIAALCGLENVFGDLEGFQPVSEEQLLVRDPDYIIAVSGQMDAETIIPARAGWSAMKAVVNGHVFAGDVDAFSRPGPRLVEAAQAVQAFVSGEGR